MREFDVKLLGERLKTLRKEAGFSQIELANELGIAQNTISQYEQGINCPSADMIFKICVALRANADYLLGLDELYK